MRSTAFSCISAALQGMCAQGCLLHVERHSCTLAVQVQSLQNKGADYQHLLAEQEAQLQALNSKLSSEAGARTTLERQLQDKQNQQQPDQQAPDAELLTERLTQAQAQVNPSESGSRQLENNKAQSQQQSTAHEASADREALTVSELRSQLRNAQAELGDMADAQKQLKQQLGERTIVLGQKAHQIAHLTAQVNGARAQPGDAPQSENLFPLTLLVCVVFPFDTRHHAIT